MEMEACDSLPASYCNENRRLTPQGCPILSYPLKLASCLFVIIALSLQVVKQALADPSTLEYGVATRAASRMRLIAAGIEGLSGEAANNVADMGHQVADILIMMRHEEVRVGV